MPKNQQPLPTVKLCHVCADSLQNKSQAAKTYVDFDELMEVVRNCVVCRDIFSDEEKSKCSISLSDYCHQTSSIRTLDDAARHHLSQMQRPIVIFLKSKGLTILRVMLVQDGWQAPQEVGFFWVGHCCEVSSFFSQGFFPFPKFKRKPSIEVKVEIKQPSPPCGHQHQEVEVKEEIPHAVREDAVKKTLDTLYTKGWVHLENVLVFTKDKEIIPMLRKFMDDGFNVAPGQKRKTDIVVNEDSDGRRMQMLWELRTNNETIHSLCCEIE